MNKIENYRPKIFETHPFETWRILEISQGRAPEWANSTIFCRVESGNGLPLTKTPPSWLIPLWPADKTRSVTLFFKLPTNFNIQRIPSITSIACRFLVNPLTMNDSSITCIIKLKDLHVCTRVIAVECGQICKIIHTTKSLPRSFSLSLYPLHCEWWNAKKFITSFSHSPHGMNDKLFS